MKHLLLLTSLAFCFASCTKFLDQKPSNSLIVPESLQDLQAILQNTSVLNAANPFCGEIAADDNYLSTSDWQARTTTEQQAYIWGKEMFNDNERNDWSLSYSAIYYANLVLDELNLPKYDALDATEKNKLRAQALFFKSWYYFQLLQLFAQPYQAATANTELGIVLRQSANLNLPSTRANMATCYQQVINDLQTAAPLLPATQPFPTLPTQAAARALLAKVYLIMNNHTDALTQAEWVLQNNNTLIDFNTLNPSAAAPIPRFNPETIFFSTMVVTSSLSIVGRVDSTLFRSYHPNDLRRSIFYRTNTDGSISFKGSYDGSSRLFNGIARDEVYLIAAETSMRTGNTQQAANYLNLLLQKRWRTGTFTPLLANDPALLEKIIAERRKELTMRGIRWSDLKRLHTDSRFAIVLQKSINNQIYTLKPADNRYIFPIPQLVIQLTGIPQNP